MTSPTLQKVYLLNLLFRIIHLFIQTALSNEIKVIV